MLWVGEIPCRTVLASLVWHQLVRSLRLFSSERSLDIGEVLLMTYNTIFAVLPRGMADSVMEDAKKAGAREAPSSLQEEQALMRQRRSLV